MRYLFATAPFTNKRKLANIVSEIDKKAGGTMLSLAEHIQKESLAEGMQQGMQQGMQRGIKEGEQRLLLKMLSKGKTVEEIADLTDQPLDAVKKLIKFIKDE